MPTLTYLTISSLLVLSLAVWVVTAMRWRSGRPALEQLPRPSSPWLPIACGASGVYVVLILSLNVIAAWQGAERQEIDVSQVVTDGLIAIVVSLALLTGAGRTPLADCGLHTQHLHRQLRDGVLGFLASALPVLLALLATLPLRTPESQHPFLVLLQSTSSTETVVWLLVSAVIIAPIKEELLFRVMLQEGLARKLGSVPAIAVSSVLFCAVHGFPDSLALLPLAVVLGYVFDRRQSVISVVVIHALFNLANIGLLMFGGETT